MVSFQVLKSMWYEFSFLNLFKIKTYFDQRFTFEQKSSIV